MALNKHKLCYGSPNHHSNSPVPFDCKSNMRSRFVAKFDILPFCHPVFTPVKKLTTMFCNKGKQLSWMVRKNPKARIRRYRVLTLTGCKTVQQSQLLKVLILTFCGIIIFLFYFTLTIHTLESLQQNPQAILREYKPTSRQAIILPLLKSLRR